MEIEEMREYSLTETQAHLVGDYLTLLQRSSLAIKIFEPATYYVSWGAYDFPIVICLNSEDLKLQAIGETVALGKMKSEFETHAGKFKINKMEKFLIGIDNP